MIHCRVTVHLKSIGRVVLRLEKLRHHGLNDVGTRVGGDGGEQRVAAPRTL